MYGRQTYPREPRQNADYTVFNASAESGPLEYVGFMGNTKNIIAMAELPANSPAKLPPYLRTGTLADNPLTMQASINDRQVLILSTTGLAFWRLPRQIDMLAAELNTDHNANAVKLATQT